MRKRMCDQKGSSARPCQTDGVRSRSREGCAGLGCLKGTRIAIVTGHDCACLLRRLTSRIGGWSDGRRNDRRSAVGGRESKNLQGSRKSWQQIRMAQVLWGPKRGAFPFGRGVKRPDANFAGEVSATREGAKDKSTPPPNNSNLFPPSALLPFPHQPSTQLKHRQYAYLQGATLFRSNCLLRLEPPTFFCSSSNRRVF